MIRSAEQAKGAVKEAAGKVFGDKKLETEGKADEAAGKMQNAVGGLKCSARQIEPSDMGTSTHNPSGKKD
jgi:uncharacterized protein YjbJ (UPF0337 family)